MRVVLRPTRDSDELPDYFFDRFGEALIAGAVSDLMLSPGKPFYNPSLAAEFKRQYSRGVIRASVEKRKLGRGTLEGFEG